MRESLGLQEKVFDEPDELPDGFAAFWQGWYRISEQYCNDLPSLFSLLEKRLFESDDELFTHDFAVLLCRALRFWQLQVQRVLRDSGDKIGLKALIQSWELFEQSFIPRIDRYKSILVKAIAVPYSFAGLSIIETSHKETAQHQSSLSLYSSMNTQIGFREGVVEYSIDLLRARFEKTLGYLAQAEERLQGLLKNIGWVLHSSVCSAALFELCDIYKQMEQDNHFYLHIRKLLLQNPSSWDFTLLGSQFCSELLRRLPAAVRSKFHSNDPVALNWAGLYALANGEYGKGESLGHQQQKNFWAQILQLKKAINEQEISVRQQESRSRISTFVGVSSQASSEWYSLQRAQLLVYYILILEHLYWAKENLGQASNPVLEENSLLWQNVMIEMYSLSPDISECCKKRFL